MKRVSYAAIATLAALLPLSSKATPTDRPAAVLALALPGAGAKAWTETVLHNFTGTTDGGTPFDGLILDQSGALYGTTVGGGLGGNSTGTVFKLSPPRAGETHWPETVLYNKFSEALSGGGAQPWAGLIRDEHGALYGTTNLGGAYDAGVVFKLTPPDAGKIAWTYAVLYTFEGGIDGGVSSGLIMDKSGNLYGTTPVGGSGPCTGYHTEVIGCGTVFKLSPPPAGETIWTKTVLHSFGGGSDGAQPWNAGLLFDKSGALYGTTRYGGKYINLCIPVGGGAPAAGCGTVFKLTPPAAGRSAWTKTVLHYFRDSDGAAPESSLIMDKAGALYGTTYAGGSGYSAGNDLSGGSGVIFKLTPPAPGKTGWTEAVLHDFTGGSDGGVLEFVTLVMDKSGALYGTTYEGGDLTCEGGDGCGVVFKLAPPAAGKKDWTETVLHTFVGGANDGSLPDAGLIADKNGVLYGMTSHGGKSYTSDPNIGGYGTVFKLTGTGFAP